MINPVALFSAFCSFTDLGSILFFQSVTWICFACSHEFMGNQDSLDFSDRAGIEKKRFFYNAFFVLFCLCEIFT